MRKLKISIILMSISMILAGCNNEDIINKNLASNKITVDEAKDIALKDANLASDEVSFIRTDTEVDNGVEKYNIEFYYENKEYDYEINATDGSIMEYDFDVESYGLSQGQNGGGNANLNSNSNANTASISEEKAKEIALNHASLTSDKVTFGKIELEFDDGVQKYDIEFYYNNKEYSYEIDANTGKILSYEQD